MHPQLMSQKLSPYQARLHVQQEGTKRVVDVVVVVRVVVEAVVGVVEPVPVVSIRMMK